MSEIRIYGDQVLRKKSLPVTEFNEELRVFAEQMIDDMYDHDGIGLAAPQVGRNIRVIVVDVSEDGDNPMIMINPEITYKSDDICSFEEGCLSIPDVNVAIKRPERISIVAYDVDGKEFTMEDVDGLFARAIQHEIDHLDGILFVDHASPVKRQLVSGKLKKLAKLSKKA